MAFHYVTKRCSMLFKKPCCKHIESLMKMFRLNSIAFHVRELYTTTQITILYIINSMAGPLYCNGQMLAYKRVSNWVSFFADSVRMIRIIFDKIFNTSHALIIFNSHSNLFRLKMDKHCHFIKATKTDRNETKRNKPKLKQRPKLNKSMQNTLHDMT